MCAGAPVDLAHQHPDNHANEEREPRDRQNKAFAAYGSREAFFQECITAHKGQDVAATAVYRAYQAWCRKCDVDPASHTQFGRGALWMRGKRNRGVF